MLSLGIQTRNHYENKTENYWKRKYIFLITSHCYFIIFTLGQPVVTHIDCYPRDSAVASLEQQLFFSKDRADGPWHKSTWLQRVPLFKSLFCQGLSNTLKPTLSTAVDKIPFKKPPFLWLHVHEAWCQHLIKNWMQTIVGVSNRIQPMLFFLPSAYTRRVPEFLPTVNTQIYSILDSLA